MTTTTRDRPAKATAWHAVACPDCLNLARRKADALGNGYLHVLCVLLDEARDDGLTWPTRTRIQEVTGHSKEWVNNRLAGLAKAGVIADSRGRIVSRSGGSGKTTIWALVPLCGAGDGR